MKNHFYPLIICEREIQNKNSSNFYYEIFAQEIPVFKQMGYLHLQVENRILSIAGSEI
ncbi:DUF4269 domain-containing protein [Leptospira sp. WS92.C1]